MRIALFFSYSTSLQDWLKAGFISRELKPFYNLSLVNGYKFYLITYGDESDFNLEESYLKKYNIEVIPLKAFSGLKFIRNLYKIFFILKKTDLFFSIQTTALVSALPASYLFNKPLISRSGYDIFAFSQKGKSLFKKYLLHGLEFFASLSASAFIFATQVDLDSFFRRNQLSRIIKNRLFSRNISTFILPNWVDTEMFCPSSNYINNSLETNKINFFSIGRLEPQKNYLNLLDLLTNIPFPFDLKIAGEGSQEDLLKKRAKHLDIDLELLGRIEHYDLPLLINQSNIYIQNSIFEGNPKSVLEAMASGIVVLCRDSPGMNQLVVDQFSGFIYNSDNLNNVVNHIVNSKSLLSITSNARNYIIENCSFSSYVSKLDIIFNKYY